MGLIKVSKFIKLLVFLLFVLLFTISAYNHFVSGETFNGVIFSVGVIIGFCWLIKETVATIKKKNMFKKEVVLDKFLMERLKTSLSLSYLYLIVHLSIAIYSFKSNDLIAFKESATFALFISFNIFMFSQIFQAFIYYTRE